MDIKGSWITKLALGIFGAVILCTGLYYYRGAESSYLEIGYLSLQNLMKALTYDAKLVAGDIFGETALWTAEGIWRLGYTVALLLFPICSFVVLFRAVAHFFYRQRVRGKEIVCLFGDRKAVKGLCMTKPANIAYYIVTNDGMTPAEIDELAQRGCFIFYRMDDILPGRLQSILKRHQGKRIRSILFLEENPLVNLNLYEQVAPLAPQCHCYLSCQEEGVYQLLTHKHDDAREGNRLTILNLEEQRVRHLLDAHPLFGTRQLETGNYPLHVLVIGLNDFTQQAVWLILNQGVMSSQSQIIIDIVTSQQGADQELFMDRFANEVVEQDFYNDKLDGSLQIRFHPKKTVTQQFLQALQRQSDQEIDIGYAIICTEDSHYNMVTGLTVSRYLQQEATVAVRLDCGAQMESQIDSAQDAFRQMVTIRGGMECLTVAGLCDTQLEERQKGYHLCYHLLASAFSNQTLEEAPDGEALWRGLSYLKKEANKLAAYHNGCKCDLLGYTPQGRLSDQEIRQQMTDMLTAVLGQEMVDAILAQQPVAVDAVAVIDRIRQHEMLYELLALEHRRWNYSMLAQGYRYAPGEKDLVGRTSPYLISFAELCDRYPRVACYDLLAYFCLIAD